MTASQTVENLTVTFTNSQVYAAPTGLTLNLWPFILILAGGCMLFLPFFLARRRRRKESEEAA